MSEWCLGRWAGRLMMVVVALLAVLPRLVLAAEVRVVLRYDDYSSHQTDPRVIAFERALFEGVRSVGGHLIVGVIPFPGARHPDVEPAPGSMPFPLGADKRELLRRYVDLGTVTPALHGFGHGNNHRHPTTSSEFAGLSEQQQTVLLRVARRALLDEAGVDARVLVPPFNTYDEATLRAMRGAGFEVLSAGRRGPTDSTVQVRYLPSTVHPRGLRRAVTAALSGTAGEGGESLIVATLHPYDFTDTGNPLPEFRATGSQMALAQWLDDLRAVARVPGVRLMSVQNLLDAGEDLTAERMRANEAVRNGAVSVLPRFLDVVHLRASDGIHYTTSAAQRLYAQQIMALLAVIAFSGLLLWMIWRTARRSLHAAGADRARRTVR